jgi:hypothetical protein
MALLALYSIWQYNKQHIGRYCMEFLDFKLLTDTLIYRIHAPFASTKQANRKSTGKPRCRDQNTQFNNERVGQLQQKVLP